MIWFIVIVNVMLALKLAVDYYLHKHPKKKVNHSLSVAIDGVVYVFSAWYFFGWDAGGWVLSAIGYRWIMFDALFNKINGWKWNFCGDSSKVDYTLDNLDGVDDNICKLNLVFKPITLAAGIAMIIWV